VSIKLLYNGKTLNLSIEDDGIGFNESEKGSSNGLINIKNRAEALKAHYKLTTTKNHGTNWYFSIEI
jgi:signal transduction histidine kinase